MKRKLCILTAVCLLAVSLASCSPTGEAGTSSLTVTSAAGGSQTTTSAADASGIRHITSEDILKIQKGMTFKEIYEMLGNSSSMTGALIIPNYFSYIVDDTWRYAQTFGAETDKSELSGAEILEKIKKDNEVVTPAFVPVQTACKALASVPIESGEGWTIYYAGPLYVYASYSAYGDYILRYNVKDNKIDKALSIKDFRPNSDYPVATPSLTVSEDGVYVVLQNFLNSLPAEIVAYPNEYVYEINFDSEEIEVLSKTQADFNLPSDLTFAEAVNASNANKAYERAVAGQQELPQLTDGAAAAPISESLYFLMAPKGDKAASYGDFECIVVDLSMGRAIKRSALA